MIRMALAQIDPVVGDITGNRDRALEAIDMARDRGAQVLVLPELTITGYPPEDLVLKPTFLHANLDAIDEVARASGDLLVICGYVDEDGGRLYNAAAICHGGATVGTYRKQELPNYGVFDERRYFSEGDSHLLIETEQGTMGVAICEDVWSVEGPVVIQGRAGAEVVVIVNASPFDRDKMGERIELLADRARAGGCSIVYVNTVGGQDELVFDGGSLVVTKDGAIVSRLPQFEEAFAVVDVPLGEDLPLGEKDSGRASSVARTSVSLREATGAADRIAATPLSPAEEMYRALCTGVRDYVRKNGFEKVVLGLSGGIDSALTATVAADALGPHNVCGVLMPSEFSSSHSVDDAKALAANLGIEAIEIPIREIYRSYLSTLDQQYGATEMGVAEENVQARIRGNLLMAISNRYGHLVLATGNKSEMAVGYATLYGDMAGGLAVLKDVFKQDVYALSRWRNERSEAIPENILVKPPSAELRPDQKDEDSLPPYAVLDSILAAYIEEDAGLRSIVESGHDAETVARVLQLVDAAEYKRRQAPPGIKVTTKAFGRDRRLPITNRWRDEVADLQRARP